MVKDNIKNAHLYYGLGERFQKALEYLAEYDGRANAVQDIVVDDGIIAKVRPYMTKPVDGRFFEGHKVYADVHFVVSGSECISYAPLNELTVDSEDVAVDNTYLTGTGVNIPLQPGDFMITFPEDGHMSGVCCGGSALCAKIIVKVQL